MHEFLAHFPLIDVIAFLYFTLGWQLYAAYSIRGLKQEDNLLHVTNQYRLQWMREMLKRETRTMDSIMVGNLLRSISFFANTTIFILLGLMTMLGYQEKAYSIIQDIPFAANTSEFLWDFKIFVLIVIFIYAFFKYTWSLRQYNYAGIFVAAAPAYNERVEEHEIIAKRGAALVTNAAKHFNLALRAYYYGLAVLAWFIHPYAFILATSWIIYVTYRREFRSNTLNQLRQP